MLKNSMILLGVLVVAASLCLAQDQTPVVKQTPIKQTNPTSGKEMYASYCAPCHGIAGKGDGPAAGAMKATPTDLTQLARKNGGSFPANRLVSVMKFGEGATGAHGSAQMPVWGPLFQSLDKFHDSAVQQRISNLVSYIETLQAK